MAHNNLYLNIIIGNKQLKYPVAQFFAPENKGPNGFTRDRWSTNNGFLQYKGYPIVSMFEFLELEKIEASYSGSIDGQSVNYEVKHEIISGNTAVPDLSYWYVLITAGSYSTKFYAKETTRIYPWTNDVGLGIGFNLHRDYKKFVLVGSNIGFRPYKTPNVDPTTGYHREYEWIYGEYIPTGFYDIPNWNYDSYENGRLYKASYYIEGGTLSLGYRTSTFTTSGLANWLNLDVEQTEYPDQNPDGDNDDSGQPMPDPSLPGDGDTISDPIPDPPPIPSIDVTDTGFVCIYNPSIIELRQLAYFMWSGDFADLIKKVFAEPFAALISLKILYAPVTTGNSQTVWLGNVETNVSMSKVTKQFTDIDLGTISISEFFGSFADYAPFTKIQIFLPFIGYKDLNTDEVMNSQLHLRYRVDVYSGACIAFLTITKTIKSTQLNSILYQFDGNCAMEIPFTSNDNSRYVSAILNSAASSALSLANSSTFTQAQPPFMMDKGESAKFTLGSLAPVANGLLDIMSTKPNVQRAGSLAGAVSSMGVKQPYIIIHRPIQHMPANYQHFIGIPLNLSRQLSAVKGYTVISQIFISSQTASDVEITMITEILKSGVIL